MKRSSAYKDLELNFEVYVDGQLRTQSGLMKPSTETRRLVIQDLAGGKRLRLVIRAARPTKEYLFRGQWRPSVRWLAPTLYMKD